MALEERRGVQVLLILLKDIDLQKAYDIGSGVADKSGAIFNGLNVFSFPSNPPRDKQTLAFFTESNKVGSIVGEMAKALGLAPNIDFLVQAFPSTQFVPRTRPSQTAS